MFDSLRQWWKRLFGEKPKAPAPTPKAPPPKAPPPKPRPLTGTDLNDRQSGEREISIDSDMKRRKKPYLG
jgi:hypothetical protein